MFNKLLWNTETGPHILSRQYPTCFQIMHTQWVVISPVSYSGPSLKVQSREVSLSRHLTRWNKVLSIPNKLLCTLGNWVPFVFSSLIFLQMWIHYLKCLGPDCVRFQIFFLEKKFMFLKKIYICKKWDILGTGSESKHKIDLFHIHHSLQLLQILLCVLMFECYLYMRSGMEFFAMVSCQHSKSFRFGSILDFQLRMLTLYIFFFNCWGLYLASDFQICNPRMV